MNLAVVLPQELNDYELGKIWNVNAVYGFNKSSSLPSSSVTYTTTKCPLLVYTCTFMMDVFQLMNNLYFLYVFYLCILSPFSCT